MKPDLIYLIAFCFLLISCQSDPEIHQQHHINKGDVVTLNKSLSMHSLESHVIIQRGEIVKERDLRHYQTSCMVDTRKLGSGITQPQSYTVSKITYNEEMYSDGGAVVRYFTEFYLSNNNQQQNILLTCQVLGGTMEHHTFPVNEILPVTGDYFKFTD